MSGPSWLACLVLAGCGGGGHHVEPPVGSPPATPTAIAATGPRCGSIASHLVEVGAARLRTPPSAEERSRRIAVIETRCTADAWTLEIRRCMARVREHDDVAPCFEMLTTRQQHALQRAERAEIRRQALDAPAGATPEPDAAP